MLPKSEHTQSNLGHAVLSNVDRVSPELVAGQLSSCTPVVKHMQSQILHTSDPNAILKLREKWLAPPAQHFEKSMCRFYNTSNQFQDMPEISAIETNMPNQIQGLLF